MSRELAWLTCCSPVGADSRTTTGAYIANRVTDKLTRIQETIWCCRSGSAADTQAISDIVQYQLGLYAMMNGPPTTQTAAAIFQEICYSNKDQLRCVNYYVWVSRWQAPSAFALVQAVSEHCEAVCKQTRKYLRSRAPPADTMTLTVLGLSSPAGMPGMAAKSMLSPSAAHCTSKPTRSAALARPTSTATATRTGVRAWRSLRRSGSSRAR